MGWSGDGRLEQKTTVQSGPPRALLPMGTNQGAWHTALAAPHQIGAIQAWPLEAHATVSQIPEPSPQDSLVMDGF